MYAQLATPCRISSWERGKFRANVHNMHSECYGLHISNRDIIIVSNILWEAYYPTLHGARIE
jgi:hypothetical protein